MRAFVIYVPLGKSPAYAKAAIQSIEARSGWEPELYEGLHPATVGKFPVKAKSRAECFLGSRYMAKMSCSLNHYNLFKVCVELDEPIAIIEHDSHCVGDWADAEFEDVLVLNVASALKQPALKSVRHLNEGEIAPGVNEAQYQGIYYKFDPEWVMARIMPGTAAYAITPRGAAKMRAVYEAHGWEQSDYIINAYNVQIQTLMPELFTFKLPNLGMSHG